MDIPRSVRTEIERAIKMRAQAKAMEAEAKDLTKQAKDFLLPTLTAYGVKKYSLQGVGVVTTKINTGSSINASKLRETLLIEGLPPDKVQEIIDKSSKTWSTEYVDFKAE